MTTPAANVSRPPPIADSQAGNLGWGGAVHAAGLLPDALGRNDGQWHSVHIRPGQSIEVRFAYRQGKDCVFEAKGQSATVLRLTGFQSFSAAASNATERAGAGALTPNAETDAAKPLDGSASTKNAARLPSGSLDAGPANSAIAAKPVFGPSASLWLRTEGYVGVQQNGTLRQVEVGYTIDGRVAARVPDPSRAGQYRVYSAEDLKLRGSAAQSLDACKIRVRELINPKVAGIAAPIVRPAASSTPGSAPQSAEQFAKQHFEFSSQRKQAVPMVGKLLSSYQPQEVKGALLALANMLQGQSAEQKLQTLGQMVQQKAAVHGGGQQIDPNSALGRFHATAPKSKSVIRSAGEGFVKQVVVDKWNAATTEFEKMRQDPSRALRPVAQFKDWLKTDPKGQFERYVKTCQKILSNPPEKWAQAYLQEVRQTPETQAMRAFGQKLQDPNFQAELAGRGIGMLAEIYVGGRVMNGLKGKVGSGEMLASGGRRTATNPGQTATAAMSDAAQAMAGKPPPAAFAQVLALYKNGRATAKELEQAMRVAQESFMKNDRLPKEVRQTPEFKQFLVDRQAADTLLTDKMLLDDRSPETAANNQSSTGDGKPGGAPAAGSDKPSGAPRDGSNETSTGKSTATQSPVKSDPEHATKQLVQSVRPVVTQLYWSAQSISSMTPNISYSGSDAFGQRGFEHKLSSQTTHPQKHAAKQAPPVSSEATKSPSQLVQSSNTQVLNSIRSASPKQINTWLGKLTQKQMAAVPDDILRAVNNNLQGQLKNASGNGQRQLSPAEKLIAADPVMQGKMRSILNDLQIQYSSGKIKDRIKDYGPFRVVLFDSGNGGLAAAKVVGKALNDATGGKVQLVTMGDHQNQPYGTKTQPQITALVFNATATAAKLDPDIIAMACNTACLAVFKATSEGRVLPSSGIPVVNLIDNTATAVARNPEVYGRRPTIISTQATKTSGLYQRLIPEKSGGQVNPYNVGASDGPVTKQGGQKYTRDLATLVNELAHRNPARTVEVQTAVDHYVKQIPKDTTSLVYCCTHYPELDKFFRKALDDNGMKHVPTFDPMNDQALTILSQIADRTEGQLPTGGKGTVGPDLVITSANGKDHPDTRPGSGQTALNNARDSVPKLAGKAVATTWGQEYGDLYRSDFAKRYLTGEVSATDAAMHGNQIRNIDTMYSPDGARRAAGELTKANSVMLLTGFNVPPNPIVSGSLPRPETDGPPGTAALASALISTGKQVSIVTDTRNRPVIEAALSSLGVNLQDSHLTLITFDQKGAAATREARELLARVKPDIVGAIALPGRNAAGERTNMGGVNIGGYNADIDEMLIQANLSVRTRTFGVGDGGNEAGIGNLDLSRVALPSPSVVGANTAVTAENSNLGAYAVAAEYLNAIKRTSLLLTPEQMQRSIEASVRAGAVDGVTREPTATVDGYNFEYHALNLDNLNGAVQGTWPSPRPYNR